MTLGACYFLGRGVDKNEAKAVELYRAAADKGESEAIHALAFLYYGGDCGFPEDREKAKEMWTKAACKGNLDSFYQLGEHFVAVDDASKGVAFLRSAAEKGHTESIAELGRMYFTLGNKAKGRGIDFKRENPCFRVCLVIKNIFLGLTESKGKLTIMVVKNTIFGPLT